MQHIFGFKKLFRGMRKSTDIENINNLLHFRWKTKNNWNITFFSGWFIFSSNDLFPLRIIYILFISIQNTKIGKSHRIENI